jgi:hypothetical protein
MKSTILLVLLVAAGCSAKPQNTPTPANEAQPITEPTPRVATEGKVYVDGPYAFSAVWIHFLEKDGVKLAVAVGHDCVAVTQLKP